jgi:hypothetical protein
MLISTLIVKTGTANVAGHDGGSRRERPDHRVAGPARRNRR